MILLDSNVLVALVDERDRRHARAKHDLRRVSGPFGVLSVVLSETCFLLEADYLRQRAGALLSRLPAAPVELEVPWWSDVFAWLARYADHSPDLRDAMLVVLSQRTSAAIWSYDKEFRTVWRRPDGKRPALIGTRPATERVRAKRGRRKG